MSKAVLLIAATEAEIAPTLQFLKNNPHCADVLITGVGIPATCFSLGRLHQKYPLVIQAGIAGAIDFSLQLSETVVIVQDEFYGFGAEDRSDFLSVQQLGLINENDTPFRKGKLNGHDGHNFQYLKNLRRCNGITVQTVHGRAESIHTLHERAPYAQIESMEGAAAFYACGLMQMPCLQLRSISNYVEPRNRSSWKISEAVYSLNTTVMGLLKEITE